MEKTRRVIAFLGALLASVAVSLALVYFDQNLRTNPNLLLKLMSGCGAAAVLCGIIWLVFKERVAPPTPVIANATATGNVVHVYSAPPHPAPAIEKTKPNGPVLLKFSKPENTTLNFENRIWGSMENSSSKPKNAITLGISNPLADVGNEPNPKAYAVGAHLTFKGAFTPDPIVERAYWVGEEANNVEIDPRSRKFILLGTFENDTWTIYDNPHVNERGRPSMQSLRSGGYFDMNPPHDRGVVPAADTITIEVRLFSVQSGHPISQQTFIINHFDSGLFAPGSFTQ